MCAISFAHKLLQSKHKKKGKRLQQKSLTKNFITMRERIEGGRQQRNTAKRREKIEIPMDSWTRALGFHIRRLSLSLFLSHFLSPPQSREPRKRLHPSPKPIEIFHSAGNPAARGGIDGGNRTMRRKRNSRLMKILKLILSCMRSAVSLGFRSIVFFQSALMMRSVECVRRVLVFVKILVWEFGFVFLNLRAYLAVPGRRSLGLFRLKIYANRLFTNPL